MTDDRYSRLLRRALGCPGYVSRRYQAHPLAVAILQSRSIVNRLRANASRASIQSSIDALGI